MFPLKDLSEDQAARLQCVLEDEYKAFDTSTTESFNNVSQTDTCTGENRVEIEKAISIVVDNSIDSVRVLIEQMKIDIAKCIECIKDPEIHRSEPFIFSSVVTRFPPVVENKQLGSTSYRTILKKASFGSQDPYLFREWQTRPVLLSGEVCLIGSTIFLIQCKLCNSSFATSGAPLLNSRTETNISLPQIQSSLLYLYELHTLQNETKITNLSSCCESLSSILSLLLAIQDRMNKQNVVSQVCHLEKEFYSQFSTYNGKLVVEVLKIRKGSKCDFSVVDGNKSAIEYAIKEEVEIEFYQSVVEIVRVNIRRVLRLLHNCRVLQATQ